MLLVCCNTNTRVFNSQHQMRLLVTDRQADRSLLGELDSITQQVHQNLSNPYGIAPELECGIKVYLQIKLHRLRIRSKLRQLERRLCFQQWQKSNLLEHHSVRFKLGVVEDVVDNTDEVTCR